MTRNRFAFPRLSLRTLPTAERQASKRCAYQPILVCSSDQPNGNCKDNIPKLLALRDNCQKMIQEHYGIFIDTGAGGSD